MLITVPALLDPAGVARVRAIVEAGRWEAGNATSGHQSALVKRNRQLPESSAAALEAGRIVLDALAAAPLFVAAALPLKVLPPLFSRYGPGEAFGGHVDGAIRVRRGSDFQVRADLSATLFLSDPAEYDGGELVIEDRHGERAVKLAAGDMLLYPATSVHRVAPVTRGERLASFLWTQSMVRDESARRTLFDLDSAVQDAASRLGQNDPAVVQLTGVYHNLLRMWADT